MNAYVEVATATMVAETVETTVLTKVLAIIKVAIAQVVTSTKRLSRGGTSLCAVSPDHIILGGTA